MYFLGDYQGLAPYRDGFLPIFAVGSDIFIKAEG
jgi:hypothetical protein